MSDSPNSTQKEIPFQDEIKTLSESNPHTKRLRNEYISFLQNPPEEMVLESRKSEENFNIWIINMKMEEGATYFEGQQFQLEFKFSGEYPFHGPEVKFVGPNIPVHSRVSSDGNIDLDVLRKNWSPTFTVHHICLLIKNIFT